MDRDPEIPTKMVNGPPSIYYFMYFRTCPPPPYLQILHFHHNVSNSQSFSSTRISSFIPSQPHNSHFTTPKEFTVLHTKSVVKMYSPSHVPPVPLNPVYQPIPYIAHLEQQLLVPSYPFVALHSPNLVTSLQLSQRVGKYLVPVEQPLRCQKQNRGLDCAWSRATSFNPTFFH